MAEERKRHMLAGVMGDPVAHSLSPKLHNYWIAQAGLEAEYRLFHVKHYDLETTFRALQEQNFRGWNLTVPHKEAALALVDEADSTARAIGAVNTVVVKNGRLFGTNTDAYGFMQNLKAKAGDLSPYKTKAVILGAGGAARAVAFALAGEGFKNVVITNRTQARAEELAAAIKGPLSTVPWEQAATALEGATLLVNTTTLGMNGQPPLDLSLKALPPSALVTDIIYKPLQTELLKAAKAKGCVTVTGIGMLIHQAAPGFEAWFGVKPKITAELEGFLLS